MLLPFQGLAKQGQKSGWGYYGNFSWQGLSNCCSSSFFCTSIRISFSWVKVRSSKEIFWNKKNKFINFLAPFWTLFHRSTLSLWTSPTCAMQFLARCFLECQQSIFIKKLLYPSKQIEHFFFKEIWWISLPKWTYLSGSFCFIAIIGSVWRSKDRAAPNSRNSINSMTICKISKMILI